MENKIELISFKLCPYVQRSVVTLLHKNVDFKITYIDLKDKPEWFLEISPLGKVPVLKIGENVLFESAVINEYLDETNGESLMPKDSLEKAKERAWIEYSSSMNAHLYNIARTKGDELEKHISSLLEKLSKLENVISKGGFFRGNEFSLVDSSYAPVFHRIFLMRKIKDDQRWSKMPKVRAWAENIIGLEEVKNSVVEDFEELFINYLKENGSGVLD